MDTIADLIDAARARTGANYTEIGERLDRSKQLVTNWRKGDKVPGDGDVLALARMAGQDGDKWLAIAQAARTEGEAKTRWQHIAQRLAATSIALAITLGIAPSQQANATMMQEQASGQPMHYAKLRRGASAKLLRDLWTWLASCLPRLRPLKDTEIEA